MKDITLVILAAGMGSRFGGLKQIEPLGPNKEFIIDYSIYDAIKAGFNKVVFIIKEENYDIFKSTIGSRVEPHIKVEYCFQKNDNIPSGYIIPSTRVKPLGTAHAILCAKEYVNEPFAIINADDYYGVDALQTAYDYLVTNKDNYGIVCYKIANTITANGSVKRGVCEAKDKFLTNIVESSVVLTNGVIECSPLDGRPKFIVPDNQLVSTNLLLFTPQIFKDIEDGLKKVLDDNKDKLDSFEYLIPDVLMDDIKNNKVKVDVMETTSTWYGVTYKEDAPSVKDSLRKLHLDGTYPDKLW